MSFFVTNLLKIIPKPSFCFFWPADSVCLHSCLQHHFMMWEHMSVAFTTWQVFFISAMFNVTSEWCSDLCLCRIWAPRCRRVRCVTTSRGWRWSSATSPVTGTTRSSAAGRFTKTAPSSPATWRSCSRYWYNTAKHTPALFMSPSQQAVTGGHEILKRGTDSTVSKQKTGTNVKNHWLSVVGENRLQKLNKSKDTWTVVWWI